MFNKNTKKEIKKRIREAPILTSVKKKKKNVRPGNVLEGGDVKSADPLWVRACRCFSPSIKGLIN